MIRRAISFCMLAAAAASGCGRDRQSIQPAATPSAPPVLTWLAESTRPAGATYQTLPDSSRFGELSGLVLDVASGQWLAVIDDRDTRAAWLSIGYADGRLSVAPNRLMYLRPGPGVSARIATRADLEAVVALPDGTFLMEEEGHLENGDVWQPAILHVGRDGEVTEVID
jgi:hypothetical protein